MKKIEKGGYIKLKDGRNKLYEVVNVRYDYGKYIVTYHDDDIRMDITSCYDKDGHYISDNYNGDNMDICEVI
ncbi:MAG: hypothetical protein NC124_02435 [Clostridium sp.]|nr:hypothetical protein [Clostridium sp.]